MVIRSLLAVALGFALFAMVSGTATGFALRAFGIAEIATFQMGFFVVNLTYTVVAASVAGYLAARIAGRLEIAHAAAIGIGIIVATFIAMRQRGAAVPGPYEMTAAGCGPVSAMVGAGIAMIQRRWAQR